MLPSHAVDRKIMTIQFLSSAGLSDCPATTAWSPAGRATTAIRRPGSGCQVTASAPDRLAAWHPGGKDRKGSMKGGRAGHRFVIRPIDNDEDAAVRCQFQPRTEDWQDTLLVEIEPPSEQRRLPRAWAAWNSTVPAAARDWNPEDKDFLKDTDPTPDHWSGRIDVPKISEQLLGPNAGIRITVTPRALALGDI